MALIDEVPEGRIGEVLTWADDDPERCQAALDAENDGPRRPQLIAMLEHLIVEGGEAVLRENRPKRTRPEERRVEPPAPTYRAVVERSMSGKPKRVVTSTSKQAAMHWDDRAWKRDP